MLTFYGLLGLAAALITRETWGPAERAAVDALEHDAARNGIRPRAAAGRGPFHRDRPVPGHLVALTAGTATTSNQLERKGLPRDIP